MSKYDFQPVTITQDDDTTFDPPLHGLVVSGEGTVSVVNLVGDTVAIVIPAGAVLPFVIPCGRGVVQVLDTGTTIDDANLIGLQ